MRVAEVVLDLKAPWAVVVLEAQLLNATAVTVAHGASLCHCHVERSRSTSAESLPQRCSHLGVCLLDGGAAVAHRRRDLQRHLGGRLRGRVVLAVGAGACSLTQARRRMADPPRWW